MTTHSTTRTRTFTPQQQLARAIQNAQANGLHVIGRGIMKADGSPFWLVPSQSVIGMCHVVKKAADGLRCDCFYSAQRGRVCAHRAAVYLHLKAEAEARQATAAIKREMAVLADHTPETFSIYK